ncbi:MAG TPA: hypothetical protein VFI42_14660 [Thermomicrobiaceae bacterium]|nr:hypothetical protein [Thermomicrobiaceae bacterium]
MQTVTRFLMFWYDFVVGDDWTVALGVVIALILTALLAHSGIAAWWLMPLAVALVLGASLWRVTRPAP